MESLLAALLQGSSSPLLGLVHMLLLRQAQADMELSHATGCLQVCNLTCCSVCLDPAVSSHSFLLEVYLFNLLQVYGCILPPVAVQIPMWCCGDLC